MTDIAERLIEKIIAKAFEDGKIQSGILAERLTLERIDAHTEITRLRTELEEASGFLDEFLELIVKDPCNLKARIREWLTREAKLFLDETVTSKDIVDTDIIAGADLDTFKENIATLASKVELTESCSNCNFFLKGDFRHAVGGARSDGKCLYKRRDIFVEYRSGSDWCCQWIHKSVAQDAR